MREVATQGEICLEDPETRIEYHVARIEYVEREDETFRYSIAPNYSVIDLLAPPLFEGIPGIDLEARRETYGRENKTPVFISERVPAENREDVRDLLDAAGMEYLNKLEWLIRTETRYAGDALYVVRAENTDSEPVQVGDLSDLSGRSSRAIRQILQLIAQGAVLIGDGFIIDDSNRVPFHALLRALYVKEKKHLEAVRSEGIQRAEGHRAGRKRKAVDDIRFEYAVVQFEKGALTAEEAARESGVSRATFFRRLKEGERASSPNQEG